MTTLERKIPLITIKSISMSTLRDDWLVGILFQLALKLANVLAGIEPPPPSHHQRTLTHECLVVMPCLHDASNSRAHTHRI